MTKHEWQEKFKTLKSQQYNEIKARLVRGGMFPRFAAAEARKEVYDKEGK